MSEAPLEPGAVVKDRFLLERSIGRGGMGLVFAAMDRRKQEMIEGADPHPSDDVYALGLIACELLAGEHPCQRNSASKARALGLAPQLPRQLTHRERGVIEAALALDCSKRPKDAAEFPLRFFGSTFLQKGRVTAVVMLAVLAGGFGVSQLLTIGPRRCIRGSSAADTAALHDRHVRRRLSWRFYERDRNVVALLTLWMLIRRPVSSTLVTGKQRTH